MSRLETGALLLAGTLIAGCQQGGQVDGFAIVDCDKGPRKGEIALNAPSGREILLGSDNIGDRLGTEQSKLRITSEGDGRFRFNLRFPIQEWTIDPNSPLPDSLGPVKLNVDYSVTFNSNNVDFRIKGDPGENGSTELKITAECTNV